MAARYGGHVVNVSATLAEVADSGTPAVLTALTKGGLAAATRSLAIEYASYGIRVNAVSPGTSQTPVDVAGRPGGGRLPPLGRAGQVGDVVDGVLFLESSPFITGEILHIDGGQSAGWSASQDPGAGARAGAGHPAPEAGPGRRGRSPTGRPLPRQSRP